MSKEVLANLYDRIEKNKAEAVLDQLKEHRNSVPQENLAEMFVMAAERGLADVVQDMLENDNVASSAVTYINEYEEKVTVTALEHALIRGTQDRNIEMLDVVLKHGGKENVVTTEVLTEALLHAGWDATPIFDKLLEKVNLSTFKSEQIDSIVERLNTRNHLDKIQAILEKKPSCEISDDMLEEVLSTAAWGHHKGVIEAVVERGGNTPELGAKALQRAIEVIAYKDEELTSQIFDVIIEKFNLPKEHYTEILFAASKNRQDKLVQEIVKAHSADINVNNFLDAAIRLNDAETVNIVLQNDTMNARADVSKVQAAQDIASGERIKALMYQKITPELETIPEGLLTEDIVFAHCESGKDVVKVILAAAKENGVIDFNLAKEAIDIAVVGNDKIDRNLQNALQKNPKQLMLEVVDEYNQGKSKKDRLQVSGSNVTFNKMLNKLSISKSNRLILDANCDAKSSTPSTEKGEQTVRQSSTPPQSKVNKMLQALKNKLVRLHTGTHRAANISKDKEKGGRG